MVSAWNKVNWDWDPWKDFRKLHRDMNRLFGDASPAVAREYPAVNLWSKESNVVLTAEIPGIEAGDLDISVHENVVTLRGLRKADTLKEGETYHRQERGSGNFVRSIQLPYDIDQENVQAKLDKGILELTLPQAEAVKPKKIAVKAS